MQVLIIVPIFSRISDQQSKGLKENELSRNAINTRSQTRTSIECNNLKFDLKDRSLQSIIEDPNPRALKPREYNF